MKNPFLSIIELVLGFGRNKPQNEPDPYSEAELNDFISKYQEEEKRIWEAGLVDGTHYTGYIDQIKQLKREGKHQEAIEILLKIIDVIEVESKIAKREVPPGYYEELAIVYRKEKRFDDEIAILERYFKLFNDPNEGSKRLLERLAKIQN